jgi:hypothetical protein
MLGDSVRKYIDYINNGIKQTIIHCGEVYEYERAIRDTKPAKSKLESGYGRKGYNIYFRRWSENPRILLVYRSDKFHPEIVKNFSKTNN